MYINIIGKEFFEIDLYYYIKTNLGIPLLGTSRLPPSVLNWDWGWSFFDEPIAPIPFPVTDVDGLWFPVKSPFWAFGAVVRMGMAPMLEVDVPAVCATDFCGTDEMRPCLVN